MWSHLCPASTEPTEPGLAGGPCPLIQPVRWLEGEVEWLPDAIATRPHPLDVPDQQHVDDSVDKQHDHDGLDGEGIIWDLGGGGEERK